MATHTSALIIEDDEKLAMIFAETLKLAEFETEVIRNGQAALARLPKIVPDIIVLDLHLPFTPGKTILEQIRADERLTETRVIVVTADPFMAAGLKDRIDLTLIKPFGIEKLHDFAARLRSPNELND